MRDDFPNASEVPVKFRVRLARVALALVVVACAATSMPGCVGCHKAAQMSGGTKSCAHKMSCAEKGCTGESCTPGENCSKASCGSCAAKHEGATCPAMSGSAPASPGACTK